MRSFTTNWFFSKMATWTIAIAACGCTLDAGIGIPGSQPPPPPLETPSGTLTQRWSIGSRFDTRACVAYGAYRMELVIRDTAGYIVARAFQPCEEMQMSVKLPTGSYVGDAWFLAADGTKVSTTLSLRPFEILNGTETFIDTDFPISSLLTAI